MKTRLLTAISLLFLAIGSSSAQSYQYLTQWGKNGTGNGMFQYPHGIAAGISGNLYIADSRTNRIQKFSSEGAYLSQWGNQGTGNGQFNFPVCVAIDSSENVYVADQQNNRIQKFSSTGTYLSQWGNQGTGNGLFQFPYGIAIDKSGNVYVSDNNNHRIQKFSSTGVYLNQWGSKGAGNGQFQNPSGIAIDSSGNVYVCDNMNHRIQKFSSNGIFLGKWGSFGTENGQFNNPACIAIGRTGNVFITDKNNNRVQQFTNEGTYINQYGSLFSGVGNGQFYLPLGIAVDPSDNLYVADHGNDRIQKFAMCVDIPDSNFKAALIAKGVDINNDGKIQVSEAKAVTSLNLSSLSIASLSGIEYFTALTYLGCGRNQLTKLDVSKNTLLTTLGCDENKLDSLDVSHNLDLTYLNVTDNHLKVLNVSKNTALTFLGCGRNQLSQININNNTALTTFGCDENLIDSLDVRHNTSLTYLNCTSNKLTQIDASQNTALTFFGCGRNQLTKLDISGNTLLTTFGCDENQLSVICIDSSQIAITNSWAKDASAVWSTTCFAPPVIISMTPDSAAYGALVTFKGHYFTGATSVNFVNETPAGIFNVLNDSTLTAIVPVLSNKAVKKKAGVGNVSVTTPKGIGYSPNNFTILFPPVINSFSPSDVYIRDVNAWTTVKGRYFTYLTSVKVNDQKITDFTIVNDSTLFIGFYEGFTSGKISITNGDGTSVSSEILNVHYTPWITTVNPQADTSGATVTIYGRHFKGADLVMFGSTDASSFKVIDDNTITAIVPAGLDGGYRVPVNIYNNGVLGSSINEFGVGYDFQRVSKPVLTDIYPASATAGSIITIYGQFFTNVIQLKINGISVSTYNLLNDYSIQATVPAGATTGKIRVTNDIGTTTSDFNFIVTSPIPTWNGTSWNTLPVNGNSVRISGNFETTNASLSGIAQFDSLTVDSTKILTIANGTTLIINTLINNGKVIVENSGNLVVYNISGTGKWQVNKSLSGNPNIYEYVSSPMESFNLSGLPGQSKFIFNTSGNNWDYATGNMIPGKGYIATQTGNSTYTGTPNVKGSVSFPITKEGQGYNLVGNPYTHSLSADEFITWNSSIISGALSFWDQPINNNYIGDFATYTLCGGVAGGGGHVPDGNISTCLGFFVQSTNNGSLQYNAPIAASGGGGDAAPAPQRMAETEQYSVRLNIQSPQSSFNQLMIAFRDNATDGYDPLYDGAKYMGNPNLAFGSLLNNKSYAILALPLLTAEKTVPLTLNAGVPGAYTISLDTLQNFPVEYDIYLKDNKNGTLINLRNTKSFITNIDAGNYQQRFSMVFVNSTITDAEKISEMEDVKIYSADNIVHLMLGLENAREVEITNIKGQTIKSIKNAGSGHITIPVESEYNGLYMVRLITDNKVKIAKVILE